MKHNKKGFTLIELLVVIAIIGLLSTLSILALNSARARARDAKRVADVKQIQTALELYYNDAGDYPASITPGAAIAYGANTYLAAVPYPPTPVDGSTNCTTLWPSDATPTYVYSRSGDAAGGTAGYTLIYCIGAKVNNIPGDTIVTASPAGMVQP
ncbi:MAG: type II secretion system protein [Patescibacteria group bacterium]|jgi:general secretion pathway protein G|nr:prepilin-type N-terminal cleavage/methylation domain-containing protein [bacterium]HQC50112.1 prepilin-type N-terminal cleavage/methylation domain-containing protein [bacterium]